MGADPRGSGRIIAPPKLEAWLDRGMGECWLRQPRVSALVEEKLRQFDGTHYRLQAWVLMPNHVHLVVDVRDTSLSQLSAAALAAAHPEPVNAPRTVSELARELGIETFTAPLRQRPACSPARIRARIPAMTDGRPESDFTAQPKVFATTHWSVVLAADGADTPESSAALEKLCRVYWYPLYAHIRRRGYSQEEAEDLTQELLQRLLERQFLSGLLREGGRFRSFLLTALDRFLAERWQRSRAQKRGGGQPIVSIDAQTAEERYRLEPRDERTPETIYEYRWAMALLDQVLDRLQQEFSEAGKDELFDQLRTYLVEGSTEMSYAERARRLGMSEAALRKAVERLRLRYQELFRQEIAHTVTSPAEVEDELRHLQTVMRG